MGSLKGKKIELASANDLKSDAARMTKAIADLKGLRTQMKKVYSDAISGANDNYTSYANAARDLGLDPNTLPEYKNFNDLQGKLDSAYRDANN